MARNSATYMDPYYNVEGVRFLRLALYSIGTILAVLPIGTNSFYYIEGYSALMPFIS